MENDDSTIGLTLETNIPEKVDESAEAMSSLKAVMEQISSQGEGMSEGFDALAKSTEECKKVEEETLESEKSRIDIVGKLKDEIDELKKKHDDLNESLKLQTVNEDQYREQSDLLVRTLNEKGTVLQRVSKEWDETTRQEEEAARVLKQATLEEEKALQKISDALQDEQDKLNEVAAASKRAADSLETSIILSLENVAGTGDGESGSGGFKGAAAAAMKAEKVLGGLASGSGYGRMGGMLESITSALGLAGGTGLAAGGLIFAFESLGPKLAKFVQDMTGATEAIEKQHAALKNHQEQAEKTKEAVDKLIGGPTKEEKETTELVKSMMGAPTGKEFRAAIFKSLQDEGVGKLTDQEKEDLWDKKDAQGKRLHPESQQEFKSSGAWPAARMEESLRRLNEATDNIVAQMPTSAGVRERVSRMSKLPDDLRSMLAEVTPEGRQAVADEEREVEEFGDRARAGALARRWKKQERDEYNKLSAKLTHEGRINEDAWRKQTEHEDKHLTDLLNRQGESNEDAWRKGMAQEEKRDIAKAKRDAHAHTPEAINRHEREDLRSNIMGRMQQEDRANVAAGHQKATPDFIRKATDQAVQNVDMGADITSAIEYAIRATQQKISRDVNQWRQRHQVMSEGP